MNTHSRNGDCRAELMAAQAFRAKAPSDVIGQILDSKTTEESVQILKKSGYLEATMQIMAEALGLMIPGTALMPATCDELKTAAYQAGELAVNWRNPV